MQRAHNIVNGAVALVVSLVVGSARAGFVGGFETFDGTTLDTGTWTAGILEVNRSISQNNELELFSYVYTTDTQKVNIGERVTVDVTGTSNGTTLDSFNHIALYLTNKTNLVPGLGSGSQSATVFWTPNNQSAQLFINNSGVAPSSSALTGMQFDTGYTFELDRESLTQITGRIRDASGNVVYEDTGVSSTLLDDDLYVAIMARNDDVRAVFDNITITPIPEPATLGMAAMSALLLRRRGR